jgi:hypothetical protein
MQADARVGINPTPTCPMKLCLQWRGLSSAAGGQNVEGIAQKEKSLKLVKSNCQFSDVNSIYFFYKCWVCHHMALLNNSFKRRSAAISIIIHYSLFIIHS